MPAVVIVTSRRPLARITGAVAAASLAIVLMAAPALGDVSFINAQRAGAGLAPVADHSGLASLARAHSAEMAASNTLFHSGNLAAKIATVVAGWQGVGENVGVGDSVAAVNSMFMQSATHRANILGNFNLAGVGVVTGSDGRVWVTQMFARASSTAPRVATTNGTVSPATSTASSPAVSGAPVERSTAPRVSRSSASRTTVHRAASEPAPAPPTVGGFPSRYGGYRIVGADGGVFAFGGAPFEGSAADLHLQEKIVGGSQTISGNGYALFGSKGGVFSFGDAAFAGSAADLDLNAPIVGGAVTPSGDGYNLFTADGGSLAFGDAVFAGSAVGSPLNAAIVGGARTATGRGYWLVGADGGVYAFGDATFFGSAVEVGALRSPIVAITATSSGAGYWLTAADGGVFAFGDAKFEGSAAGQEGAPVKALVRSADGHGYWLIRSDGQTVPFGIVDGPVLRMLAVAGVRFV